MTELGSLAELKGKKGELEDETERELREADENREEAAEASDALGDQPEPSVDETRQGLNDVLEGFGRHVEDETERHRELVADRVETEKSDLSEPVREGEETEREAAAELGARAGKAGRYGENLVEGEGKRSEAAELLGDLGQESEDHQERSTEEAERLSREAKAAAEALKRY